MSKILDCGDFELTLKITIGIHARRDTIAADTKAQLAPLAEKITAAVDALEGAAIEVLAEDLGLTPDVRDVAVTQRIDHLKKAREAEEVGRAAKAAKRAGR
jgi:hypothetical protein